VLHSPSHLPSQVLVRLVSIVRNVSFVRLVSIVSFGVTDSLVISDGGGGGLLCLLLWEPPKYTKKSIKESRHK